MWGFFVDKYFFKFIIVFLYKTLMIEVNNKEEQSKKHIDRGEILEEELSLVFWKLELGTSKEDLGPENEYQHTKEQKVDIYFSFQRNINDYILAKYLRRWNHFHVPFVDYDQQWNFFLNRSKKQTIIDAKTLDLWRLRDEITEEIGELRQRDPVWAKNIFELYKKIDSCMESIITYWFIDDVSKWFKHQHTRFRSEDLIWFTDAEFEQLGKDNDPDWPEYKKENRLHRFELMDYMACVYNMLWPQRIDFFDQKTEAVSSEDEKESATGYLKLNDKWKLYLFDSFVEVLWFFQDTDFLEERKVFEDDAYVSKLRRLIRKRKEWKDICDYLDENQILTVLKFLFEDHKSLIQWEDESDKEFSDRKAKRNEVRNNKWTFADFLVAKFYIDNMYTQEQIEEYFKGYKEHVERFWGFKKIEEKHWVRLTFDLRKKTLLAQILKLLRTADSVNMQDHIWLEISCLMNTSFDDFVINYPKEQLDTLREKHRALVSENKDVLQSQDAWNMGQVVNNLVEGQLRKEYKQKTEDMLDDLRAVKMNCDHEFTKRLWCEYTHMSFSAKWDMKTWWDTKEYLKKLQIEKWLDPAVKVVPKKKTKTTNTWSNWFYADSKTTFTITSNAGNQEENINGIGIESRIIMLENQNNIDETNHFFFEKQKIIEVFARDKSHFSLSQYMEYFDDALRKVASNLAEKRVSYETIKDPYVKEILMSKRERDRIYTFDDWDEIFEINLLHFNNLQGSNKIGKYTVREIADKIALHQLRKEVCCKSSEAKYFPFIYSLDLQEKNKIIEKNQLHQKSIVPIDFEIKRKKHKPGELMYEYNFVWSNYVNAIQAWHIPSGSYIWTWSKWDGFEMKKTTYRAFDGKLSNIFQENQKGDKEAGKIKDISWMPVVDVRSNSYKRLLAENLTA